MDFGALISASSEFHIGLPPIISSTLIIRMFGDARAVALPMRGRASLSDVDGLVDFSSDLESPQPVIAAGLEFLAAGSVPIRAVYLMARSIRIG